MLLTEVAEVLGEKTVPMPLCPPQITHGPTWYSTRTAIRGRRFKDW